MQAYKQFFLPVLKTKAVKLQKR